MVKERVRQKTEERSGRAELRDRATQEVDADECEDVRRTIMQKVDEDEPILNPPETADEHLAADLCESLRSRL